MFDRSKLYLLSFMALACALFISPARAMVDSETLDGLELNVASGNGTPNKYLIEYVTISSGGQTTNNWFEVPFQSTGPSFQANFLNVGSSNLTLSNVGFFLSDTQIPLDQLNLNDYPVTPIPGFDGSLSPGSSFGPSVPEPSTWAMLIIGFAGLGFLAYRRKSDPFRFA
jgi:PEP-CTERM motif